LPGRHGLVVVDRHERHPPRHLGRDAHHVDVDEGIVGRFVVARGEPPQDAAANGRQPGDGKKKRQQDRSPPAARHLRCEGGRRQRFKSGFIA